MFNDSLQSLVEELIRLRSVTPNDAGCLELIGSKLAALGFGIERIEANGVSNLWARRGISSPLVCFAGHTDVVPTGPLDEWDSDPFTPTTRDGVLYGRGAADMKSSLAAYVRAVEMFVTRNPDHPGSIAFLLTSDEEGEATDGTVRVVEKLQARGERIDFCVVGEPTCVEQVGDTIKNGRRGSLSARLVVRGVQGHVAYPEKVRNPVHLAVPALTELAGEKWDEGNPHFPPTSFQISNISAGTGATNVVPGSMEIMFNFRFSTASTAESLQMRVHDILDRHRLEYDIQWTVGARPFLTASGRLVEVARQAIYEATGVTPSLSTTGGTSDGRFIVEICPEVIEFGPVNASLHKINEHIRIDALEPLANAYRGILEGLLVS